MSTAHILLLVAFAILTASDASAAFEMWYDDQPRLAGLLGVNAVIFLLLFFATLYS